MHFWTPLVILIDNVVYCSFSCHGSLRKVFLFPFKFLKCYIYIKDMVKYKCLLSIAKSTVYLIEFVTATQWYSLSIEASISLLLDHHLFFFSITLLT